MHLVGIFILEKPRETTPDLLSLLEAGFVREPGERLFDAHPSESKKLHRLTTGHDLNDIRVLLLAELHRAPQHLRVEWTGKTPVRSDSANGDVPYLFPPGQERVVTPGPTCDVPHHLLHVIGVGPYPIETLPSPAELDGGDGLHSPRYLGGIVDRLDLSLHVL